MNSDQRRKWLPAVVVPVAVGMVALGGGIVAAADTDLPDKTANEVLAMVAAHQDTSFSGQFEASFALGLPQLPTAEGAGGSPLEHGTGSGQDGEGAENEMGAPAGLAELIAALSGTHQARVFVDGKERSRLQMFDGTEERNIVRNGDEVWDYDSAENRAVHAVLPEWGGQHDGQHGDRPEGSSAERPEHGVFPGENTTPDQLAGTILDGLDPSTQVTVEQDNSVAGREAYTLRLDPRTEDTLVEDVTIAVDAATGTPLSVRVQAVGQEAPAISAGFTEFSAETPDAGLFDFTPPEGAEVEQLRPEATTHDRPDHGEAGQGKAGQGKAGQGKAGHGDREPGPDVATGTGWDAVVVIPAEDVPDDLVSSPIVEQYATDTDAGRVLSMPLTTILLADDGRVLAGAVPLQRLLDVAESG